jgi:hypothetical protein
MENIRTLNKDEFLKLNSQKERITYLLRYAILAPSTHNSQPWLFRITDSSCKIYMNPKYILPKADPMKRDLFISIGCALENLILAAKFFSMYASVSYGPFSEKDQIGEVFFENTKTASLDSTFEKLVTTIPTRINARGFFDTASIDIAMCKGVEANIEKEYFQNGIHIHFVEKKEKIEKIATLTADGLRSAYQSASFRNEMSHWMNNSMTKKEEGIPGYSLRMPFLFSFFLPTLVKFFDLGNFLAKLNYKSLNSVPLVCVITAPQNNQLTWLGVGRIAERLMLEYNSIGLNTSVFVASVEMGELHKTLMQIIETKDIPQFLFVIGKVDTIPKYTPRHNVLEKIIS